MTRKMIAMIALIGSSPSPDGGLGMPSIMPLNRRRQGTHLRVTRHV